MIELKAYRREESGKGVAKRLLRQGKIPGILYARGEESVKLYVDEKEFLKILQEIKGRIPTLTLSLAGENLRCIMKSIMKDPIKNRFIHIDFQKVHPEEEIVIKCPIVLMGVAPGVKMGGILDHHLRDVPVKGRIDLIPPRIEVDISNLKLGHSIHLSDIKLSGCHFLLPPDTPVVSILVPKKVEEVKVEAAPAPAEPELIEKKEEKEEKEGKEPKGEKKER